MPNNDNNSKAAQLKEINFNDVPSIKGVSYYDGELAFADDVVSLPMLVKAYKVNFNMLVFCIAGELDISVGGTRYHVTPNEALLVNSHNVISDICIGEDFQCKILGISNEVEYTFIHRSIIDTFLNMCENPLLRFTPDEMLMFSKYYELANYKMTHPNLSYGRETMQCLLRAYVLDIIDSVNRHLTDESGTRILRQGDKIFRRFLLLLSNVHNQERTVKSFAAKLCVTPKYLTSVCRNLTGRTASEIITSNTVSRVRQQLLYSDRTIKEIAAYMGFDNLSFFGKFVKKHLGASPNNYRRDNRYGE